MQIPEFMTSAIAPGRGRFPRLLIPVEEMTPEQLGWLLRFDHNLYIAQARTPQGELVGQWIGVDDWTWGVENHLTSPARPRRRGTPPPSDPRTHTITVWATEDRTPTDVIAWTPEMQAEMDRLRADRAAERAARLEQKARASERAAAGPAPAPPPQGKEPLAEWERELLGL